MFSKVIGLFASFGLVVLSTRIWGAEGRGYISIILADAALIGVLALYAMIISSFLMFV